MVRLGLCLHSKPNLRVQIALEHHLELALPDHPQPHIHRRSNPSSVLFRHRPQPLRFLQHQILEVPILRFALKAIRFGPHPFARLQNCFTSYRCSYFKVFIFDYVNF